MNKYIVGEMHNNQIIVEAVVRKLKEYTSRFEPIDIVHGEYFAWNDKGERYIFLAGTDFDAKNESNKKWGVVDVGSWGEDGPILQRDGVNSTEDIIGALRLYLAENKVVLSGNDQSINALIDICSELS